MFEVNSYNPFAMKHRWSSGRILACHAGDPGSIPGRCKLLCVCVIVFLLFFPPSNYCCFIRGGTLSLQILKNTLFFDSVLLLLLFYSTLYTLTH